MVIVNSMMKEIAMVTVISSDLGLCPDGGQVGLNCGQGGHGY